MMILASKSNRTRFTGHGYARIWGGPGIACVAGGWMLIWLSDFGTLSDGIHVYFWDVLLVQFSNDRFSEKERGQWGDGGDVVENADFQRRKMALQRSIFFDLNENLAEISRKLFKKLGRRCDKKWPFSNETFEFGWPDLRSTNSKIRSMSFWGRVPRSHFFINIQIT